MKTILLFVFFIAIGIVGYYLWSMNKSLIPIIQLPAKVIQQPTFSVEQPPTDSRQGTIESISGNIEWQSRIATQPAKLIAEVPIQQGESLLTGDDGKATVTFKDAGSIILSPKSKVDFIQTLPTNFVFGQSEGTLIYTKNGKVPFSIRTLHMVTSMSDGVITSVVDAEKHTVTITVQRGSVTIAFNSLQYISTVVPLKEGQEYVFDDDLREGEIN